MWKRALYLECDVVDGEYVLVRGESVRVMVLPQELVGRDRLRVDRLQRYFLARRAVLGEVDAREPALADLLHHVVLGVEVDLKLCEGEFSQATARAV